MCREAETLSLVWGRNAVDVSCIEIIYNIYIYIYIPYAQASQAVQLSEFQYS